MNWINIKDQEPHNGQRVFVYNDGYFYLGTFYSLMRVFRLDGVDRDLRLENKDTNVHWAKLQGPES